LKESDLGLQLGLGSVEILGKRRKEKVMGLGLKQRKEE